MSNDSMRSLVPALLRRPSLWLDALRAGWAHRPRGGWRAWLPIPERRYWDWRLQTAFGDGPVRPDEVLAVLDWRRRLRRAA